MALSLYSEEKTCFIASSTLSMPTTFKNVYLFVDMIINLTVQSEFMINLNFLLIINFLREAEANNQNNPHTVKPDLFYKYIKTYTDMAQTITPANLTLLLFKLIRNTNLYSKKNFDNFIDIYKNIDIPDNKYNELTTTYKEHIYN